MGHRIRKKKHCKGAAMVEAAIVLPVCVLLLLGMFDASLLILRHTAMSAVARQVAREAIIHGSRASSSQGNWGPQPVTTSAEGGHPATSSAAGLLMAQNPAQVTIKLNWPDGDNTPGNRVRVMVSCVHTPLIGIPGWYGSMNLVGVSTMTIAH